MKKRKNFNDKEKQKKLDAQKFYYFSTRKILMMNEKDN